MKRLLLLFGGLFMLSMSLMQAQVFHATPTTYKTEVNNFIQYVRTHNSGTITLYLSSGLYKFDSELYHNIYISNVERPNLSITIAPESGATVNIISDGNTYQKNVDKDETVTQWPNHYYVSFKSGYTRGEVFVDQNFNTVPISDSGSLNESMQISRASAALEQQYQIRDGYYYNRIKLPSELSFLEGRSGDYFKKSLIWWHIWYRSYYGVIDKVEGGYIYFYGNGGGESSNIYNREKGYEMFYITNITDSNKPEDGKILVMGDGMYVPNSVTTLYECKHQTLVGVSTGGSKYKQIKLSNLNFVGASNFDVNEFGGSNEGNITYNRRALLDFSNIDNVIIENCTFRNIGSSFCIYNAASQLPNQYNTVGATNFTVKGCTAYNLGGGFVYSNAGNTVISNNNIHDVGRFDAYSAAISAGGPDNEVTNNTIYNFPYIGIYAGSVVRSDEHKVNVRVQNNELYMTSEFRKYLYRNTIDDGGAIYFYTHHDGSECIGNVIHDISSFLTYSGDGICHRAAIMGDDGAYRVKITRNLVFNVSDWPVCFYWNSQYAPYQNDPFYICSDNEIYQNLFFGPYQFQGNSNVKDTHPNLVSTNYVAKDMNGSTNVFGDYNIDTNESVRTVVDIIDNNAKIENGKCVLTQDYSVLDLDAFVKKFISGSGVIVNVPVSGVTLNMANITIKIGEQADLIATVAPGNATNKTVTWSSNNTSVATVSNTGKITAVSEGTATITVKTTDGNYTKTCTVNVNETNTPVTGIEWKAEEHYTLSLTNGNILTLSANVLPSNATNQALIWTSSNPSVVTVDSNGNITALAAGEATISAETEEGSFSASCTITVNDSGTGGSGTGGSTGGGSSLRIPVSTVSISTGSITVNNANRIFHLTVMITPSNATNKSVKWTSSDDAVATVDQSGTVAVHKRGSCAITAAVDGKETSCYVLSTVANLDVDGSTVWTNGSTLFIKSVRPKTLRIYSMNGTLIRTSESVVGEQQYSMQSGIYVVQLGELRKIVIVR